MKKYLILIMAFVSFLVFSCRKDTEENAPVAKADYYQLKTGNYWIYEGYSIDTNGVTTVSGEFDSTYVEKDTVINKYTFSKIRSHPYYLEQQTNFLRDSSGYLVNIRGTILASDADFVNVLHIDSTNASLCMCYMQMTGMDSLVTIPAGQFQSITSRLKVVPTQPADKHPVRYSYNVYGKGIGLIKSHAFFYGSGLVIESRLVRYHVGK
jgi:flagellar hook protein FlgE